MDVYYCRVIDSYETRFAGGGMVGSMNGYSDKISRKDAENDLATVELIFELSRAGWRAAYRIMRRKAKALGEELAFPGWGDEEPIRFPG